MSETIVGGALQHIRDVKIATKFGFDLTDEGGHGGRMNRQQMMLVEA